MKRKKKRRNSARPNATRKRTGKSTPGRNMKRGRKRERKSVAKRQRKPVAKRKQPAKRKVKHERKAIQRKALPTRKKQPRKTTRAAREIRKPISPKFRDQNGRFISQRKWERKNLPKIKRKGKVKGKQKGKAGRKRKGWKEGDRFKTPKAKYEYRQFILEDFKAETIKSVIESVKAEPKPHPILFFIHIDYDDEEGDSGDVGTHFFKFNEEEAYAAEFECDTLSESYGIASISGIEMMATYSIV